MIGLREQIKMKIEECKKIRQRHSLDRPFNIPSVSWHEAYGKQQGYEDVLSLLADYVVVSRKQLRKIAKEIKSKCNFESQHVQLDRKSGYIVSKPQQDFINFLAWLDDKFEKVLEGDI